MAVVSRAQDPAQPPADSAATEAVAVNPDAPPPKKPLLKRLVSVQAVGATLPGAVLQQFHDWPSEWGKHRAGFEKRAASLYGQFVLGVLIEDGVKAMHHEDTSYRRRGTGNFFGRAGYALVHTFVARKPDGGMTPAYSLPANAYGSWAIATLWSPREFRTLGSIFKWGSAGVGVAAGTNLVREFWPDIKHAFHKKKAPAISARLPESLPSALALP